MEPTFRNGDMVFVEYIPNGTPLQFCEIGAFAVGNERYIKEYKPDGLRSHNERYPIMRFDDVVSVYRIIDLVDPEQIATEKEIQGYLENRKANN